MNEPFLLKNFQYLKKELENSDKIQTGIHLIDNFIGGIFPGQVHAILGDSGVGKSWFCQKLISSLLRSNNNATTLYSNFSGNIRLNNFKKVLIDDRLLDQVKFFDPTSLLENIILCKKVIDGDNPDISLLIFDMLFGSPFQFSELLRDSRKKWERNIFHLMVDLRKIAHLRNIPIIVVNYLSSDSLNVGSHNDRYLDPFCATKSILQKVNHEYLLNFYIHNRYLGSTPIHLFKE